MNLHHEIGKRFAQAVSRRNAVTWARWIGSIFLCGAFIFSVFAATAVITHRPVDDLISGGTLVPPNQFLWFVGWEYDAVWGAIFAVSGFVGGLCLLSWAKRTTGNRH